MKKVTGKKVKTKVTEKHNRSNNTRMTAYGMHTFAFV